ncbi:polymorphic toxin-type HINT domain-containing protein [Streptomyces sp. NPDC001834]|uniref:polymorphic toxin-type HINT domain-containing protein n=1 Tax=Streptomyces sp. NPDC001834 TaxID=3364616 RepID=UPI0036BC2925
MRRNGAGSFAGGLAGKFLAKYGAPWNWNKAYKLIKRVTGLVGDLVDSAQEMWKASKAYDKAKGAWAAAKSKLAKSCHSFLPGTQVELADGKRKNIEDVALGDTVVTTDPKTGKKLTRKVVGTIVTEDDKEFVDLTVATPDGDSSLVATVTHPFWVANEHRFVDAGDLKPGMLLQTPEGKTYPVKNLRFFTERQRTHDLTIDDVHAYYVLAGATPVLVHNCGGSKLKEGEQYVYRAVKDDELKQLLDARRFQNPRGIESKYFSSTPEGAALYARSAHAKFPDEGAYTLVRGVIRTKHIPAESRIEHLADGGGGIDAFALWEDSMSTIGRVRILPSMPIP